MPDLPYIDLHAERWGADDTPRLSGALLAWLAFDARPQGPGPDRTVVAMVNEIRRLRSRQGAAMIQRSLTGAVNLDDFEEWTLAVGSIVAAHPYSFWRYLGDDLFEEIPYDEAEALREAARARADSDG